MKEIEIYNKDQQLVLQDNGLKGKEYKLNTQASKEGINFIHIYYMGEVIHQKLLVTK